MRAEPAVDVDRADGRVHAFALHERNDFADSRRIEVRELGVVDGDVGDAARAVLRQHHARDLGDDSGGDGAQALGVGATHRLRVDVVDADLIAVADQGHGAVLGDDGGERRLLGDGAAPAHRPAGDRDHRQSGFAQRGERGDDAHRDRAVGRQRVVDVGEDAAHAGEAPWLAARPRRDGRRNHAAMIRVPDDGSGGPALESRRCPRSVARQDPRVRVPGLAQFDMQPRSPARWSSWVSSASLPTSVLRVPHSRWSL